MVCIHKCLGVRLTKISSPIEQKGQHGAPWRFYRGKGGKLVVVVVGDGQLPVTPKFLSSSLFYSH